MSENPQKVNSEEKAELKHNVEGISESKNGFITWIKSHKTELILAGISIATIIGIVLGIKNKDALMELWSALSKSINKAPARVATVGSTVATTPVMETVASTRAYTSPTEVFDVSGHIRTMAEGWHHSAAKAAEAAALGIKLLPNQTLVNPYTKGGA